MALLNKKSLRILIVDDEEIVRSTIGHIFQKRDFIVDDAADGIEALQMVAKHRPDIIILDVVMPRMDGLQMYRELREDSRTRDIPVIFLSAQGHISEVIHDIPGGFVDYIDKPCNIDCLLQRVNALLTKERDL